MFDTFLFAGRTTLSNGIDAGQLGVRAVGSVESAVHSMHALEQRMELQFARDEDKKNQALLNAKC